MLFYTIEEIHGMQIAEKVQTSRKIDSIDNTIIKLQEKEKEMENMVQKCMDKEKEIERIIDKIKDKNSTQYEVLFRRYVLSQNGK